MTVCRSACWYGGEDGRIKVEKDQCIFCGACANSCHCFAVEVDRSAVTHTPVKETPWAEEWKEAISAITTKVRRRPDLSGIVLPPEIERVPIPEIEAPARDPDLLSKINEALAGVEAVINKPKVRFVWERGGIEEAREKIGERIRKAKAEAAAEAEGGDER